MKKFILTLSLCFLLSAPAYGALEGWDGTIGGVTGDSIHLRNGPAVCAGFQNLTVSSTAVSLTVPQYADFCLITVETDQVRSRADGTDPTSAVGRLWESGDRIRIDGNLLMDQVKFIRVTSDATLMIDYYQYTRDAK